MKKQSAKAFSIGDTALTDADGFVAEADRFLITGKESDLAETKETVHPGVEDESTPPEPLKLADVVLVSASGPESAQAEAAEVDSAQAESAQEVVKLGEAAIAVNEAEVSLEDIAEELDAGQSREGLRGVVQGAKGELNAFSHC